MKQVFLDTNILLDVVLGRPEFIKESAKILTCIQHNEIMGYCSAMSLVNSFYFLRKSMGLKVAKKQIMFLDSILSLTTLDQTVVTKALASTISDFEDAVQVEEAKIFQVNYIISRDKKDFKKSPITVLTPKEYLLL